MKGIVDPDDTGKYQINKRYHLKDATALGFNLDTEAGNEAYARYLYEKEGVKPWKASSKCQAKILGDST